jgi:hypothetical protein
MLAGELYSPRSGDPFTVWLEALKKNSKHYSPRLQAVNEKGASDGLPRFGTIEQVCEASADFCRQLEVERAQVIRVNLPAQSIPDYVTRETGQKADLSTKAGRRNAIDAYMEEVFRLKAKRITRTDIWRAVHYKTRTEFERWERDDKRATKAAHERFTRMLSEKPHLK